MLSMPTATDKERTPLTGLSLIILPRKIPSQSLVMLHAYNITCSHVKRLKAFCGTLHKICVQAPSGKGCRVW